MKQSLPPRTPVRTKWSTLVSVCRECHGGKGFAKTLRRAYKGGDSRTVRVVSSSCFDVCPKRGVTVATMICGAIATIVVDDTLEGEAARAAVFPATER